MHRILIIEDDYRLRQLIDKRLSSLGYITCLAADGLEALVNLDNAHPNLVVLDFQMPRMDGATFLKIIRQDQTRRHIPVILISARDPAEIMARIGGDAISTVLDKFDPRFMDKLVAAVRSLTGEVGTVPEEE